MDITLRTSGFDFVTGEWSVVASGWDDEMDISPMSSSYNVYSIEEVLSMREAT